jgi:translation initiation factor IF-2
MTLKEFSEKYELNANELLEILIFEKHEIKSIDEEINDALLVYLLDYVDKKPKIKGRAVSFRGNKNNNKKFSKNKKEDIFIPILKLGQASISLCSKNSALSIATIISFFIKKGKLYSISTILTEEEIIELGKEFKIEVEKNKKTEINKKIENKILDNLKNDKIATPKQPVIVVVGHVDHGKTTLLDTIRKKTVAKMEKGGITQHIGAYEVTNNNKKITFLDTPGHAAFTALRGRGISVADIAILVIASDDGVMPQTIESIKMLKEIKTTTIVAFTKSDKKEKQEKEKLYKQLTENGIIPEEWGGDVPCVNVSGTTGDGISELLEIISLTSEMMDLRCSLDVNPIGYILESRIDKGRGPVGTIILQHGVLKTGDFFCVNDVIGKVNNIYDSDGNSLKEVYPAKPFVLCGFESLPDIGQIIKVGKLKDIKKIAEEEKISRNLNKKKFDGFYSEEREKIFNIFLKTDVFSSLQAIEQAIRNIGMTSFYKPNIISASVGTINENDITLAATTRSIIYAFNTKIEPGIDSLVEQLKIKILYFDVIYHLLNDLEEKIKNEKKPKTILKKIGDLLALKIFDVKGIGKIVGFKVSNGIVKQNSFVVIKRDKNKIGEGGIKSLQKDKKSVKELAKGYEGAISVDGFSDWQEQDQIEIYSVENNYE